MNEFDLNTLVDHLEQKDDFYCSIQIRHEFFINLLGNKYDGALSTYQAYDVVRMMVEITILMVNMSTINNMLATLSACYSMCHFNTFTAM
jgi:hypothetical protein